MSINKYLDYTKLAAYTTEEEIRKLCSEAIEYDFKAVCINPCFVEFAKDVLRCTSVKVCTVIGFPLGANRTDVKVYETVKACEDGADEIDMVINIGALKAGNYDYIKEEIGKIREASQGRTLKVIIETCYLDIDEIVKMTEICNDTGVDFIKTSTGFGSRGASLEDVKVMAEYKNDKLEIKASGGIRTYEESLKYIDVGATRLGVSAGVDIMKGECDE